MPITFKAPCPRCSGEIEVEVELHVKGVPVKRDDGVFLDIEPELIEVDKRVAEHMKVCGNA